MYSKLTFLTLIYLSLLSLTASAWQPKIASTPTTSNPISIRQNTRAKIVHRATAKRAREDFNAVKKEHPEVFGRKRGDYSVPSPKVYPKCPGSKGLGYANYASWDYYSNDIPGNPRYAKPNTEENCIALCSDHQLQKRTPTPDTSCIGVVYVKNGPCYLKGELFKYGRFQKSDEKHSVDLVGGCAAWAGVVPPEMDAVCCNL